MEISYTRKITLVLYKLSRIEVSRRNILIILRYGRTSIDEERSTLIFCIHLREPIYTVAVLAHWVVQFQIMVRHGKYLSGALCMGSTLSILLAYLLTKFIRIQCSLST